MGIEASIVMDVRNIVKLLLPGQWKCDARKARAYRHCYAAMPVKLAAQWALQSITGVPSKCTEKFEGCCTHRSVGDKSKQIGR